MTSSELPSGRGVAIRPAITSVLGLWLSLPAGGVAAQPATSSDSAAEPWIDIDQLASMRVVAVSREDQDLFRSAAAVALVTAEDIERGGAMSLPEALRQVPGLNVAQINANGWAVGARGFQWQFANKLLVMIDGRSVYSATLGGVRWEDNPVFLDDVDRIEVVRGPGSSVWGANAVNGVISVVSKNAFDTLGVRAFAAGGNELHGHGGLRYGVQLSDRAALRLYGQYSQVDEGHLPTGAAGEDGARSGQGGFRLDWRPSGTDDVTLQGDVVAQNTDYVRTLPSLAMPPSYAFTTRAPVTARGTNLLARWRHRFGGGAYLEARAYWDWLRRDRPQNAEARHTLDGELVFGTPWGDRQRVTSGVGYRLIDGDLGPKQFNYSPSRLRTQLGSAFVQDEVTLVRERLDLTLGLRIEHHTFTGWEPQPTARLAATLTSDLVLWAAAAQAIRTPTWSEEVLAGDARVAASPTAGAPPNVIRILGNRDLSAEKLTAFELGLRWKLRDHFSWDLALFRYRYHDYVLITDHEMIAQASPPAQVRATRFTNGIEGSSTGGELAGRWTPTPWWHVGASHSYVHIDLAAQVSDPFDYEQDEDTTPRHATRVHSAISAGPHWELDLAGRHVGEVPYYSIASYFELDARLAWKPSWSWQVALVGRNLLHARHAEYDSALARRLTELDRSVQLTVRWRH